MSFFSKKWRVILIIVAALAASSFAVDHFLGFNPVSVAVNTVTAPVKTGFSYIARTVTEFRDFIWDMRAYKADNERLEAENITLKQQNRDIAAYREENERLQALLELKNTFGNYSMVAAKIISYSGTNNCEQIEINKGALHGIVRDNAVLSNDGIVGKVTEVGPNYAIVKTILDASSAVGIRVSRTGGTGLIEGDTELAGNNQCKLSFMDKNTPLIVGDVIETSGSGGIYPPGYPVGTVMSIAADTTGTLSSAVIDPAVDFDKISEVLVINGEY